MVTPTRRLLEAARALAATRAASTTDFFLGVRSGFFIAPPEKGRWPHTLLETLVAATGRVASWRSGYFWG